MNHYLALSDYELSFISGGLRIMMTENAKTSMETAKKDSKKHYETLSLELFTLCSKVKTPNMNKYIELSLHELRLMKNGLMFLADFIYQKSLRDRDQDKTRFYEKCNLKLIEIRKKINNMESNNSYLASN